MPIFDPFPHHLDRVLMAFDYLRIDGWAVPPDDTVRGLEVLVRGKVVHRETKRLGLQSPDVALHPRCRFSLSCLIPDVAKVRPITLRLLFRRHRPLDLPLNGVSRDWTGDVMALWDRFLKLVPPRGRILEIGSKNRTGFGPRAALPDATYVGVDIAPGANVDRVVDAHELGAAFEPGSFDAICSFVVFEHLAMPWKVALEMNRVLKEGGVAYVLTVQSCALHELPWDFFRFSDSAFRTIFNAATGFEVIETKLGVPVHIFPFVSSPLFPDNEQTAGFGAAEVLVRKIGETQLSWNVPLSAVISAPYPENAPFDMMARLDERDEGADTGLPPLLLCDEPPAGAPEISSRLVRFAGWSLAPERVEEVQLLLDGELVATAAPRLARPDVAAVHRSYRDAEHSGYEMWLDRRDRPAGAHVATLRAVIPRGRTVEVTRRIELGQVQPPAPAAFRLPRIQVEWADGERRVSVCPACRRRGLHDVLLSVDPPLPGNERLWVLGCPDCASAHVQGFESPPYGPDTLGPAFIRYYVEQGAGIDIMVRPLCALAATTQPPLLEIGCGFGFALDFATRELGWAAHGIEPSYWGTSGRELLGVDIRSDFLRADLATDGAVGCVYASEVLEHLDDPALLFEHAARALRPDGRLALTTPDGTQISRGRSVDELWMIVSPGLHHVLFSPRGLEACGREHGFPHARIRREHQTLSAVFGRSPLTDPAGEDERWGHHYQRYVAGRLPTFPRDSALFTGFAYRLFKDQVNRGQLAEAAGTLAELLESCRLRFGIDLDDPAALHLDDAPLLGFGEFSERYPFCLATALYFIGIFTRNHRHDGEAAARCFDAVGPAGRLVRHALGTVSAVDGETEDLQRHALVQAQRVRAAR